MLEEGRAFNFSEWKIKMPHFCFCEVNWRNSRTYLITEENGKLKISASIHYMLETVGLT